MELARVKDQVKFFLHTLEATHSVRIRRIDVVREKKVFEVRVYLEAENEGSAPPVPWVQTAKMGCSIEKERWKAIRGYEGLYYVSDRGRIRDVRGVANRRAGGIISSYQLSRQGDYLISLKSAVGSWHMWVVSRLTAEAFCWKGRVGYMGRVVHKDGDKTNNCWNNLDARSKGKQAKIVES